MFDDAVTNGMPSISTACQHYYRRPILQLEKRPVIDIYHVQLLHHQAINTEAYCIVE